MEILCRSYRDVCQACEMDHCSKLKLITRKVKSRSKFEVTRSIVTRLVSFGFSTVVFKFHCKIPVTKLNLDLYCENVHSDALQISLEIVIVQGLRYLLFLCVKIIGLQQKTFYLGYQLSPVQPSQINYYGVFDDLYV